MPKITATFVKNLKPPKQGSVIHHDSGLIGFGVRITAANVIAFILGYHVHGRKRRYTIGRYPSWSVEAARSEALQLQEDIRQGVDPLVQRHTPGSVATSRTLPRSPESTRYSTICGYPRAPSAIE